ncbi:hypothetical protein HBI55_139670 [Parastagonospora nodorum]|nr:hypothetical protein HBI79_149710 [Parastagonospora nodorum]KAH6491664.1 hypothetical protein HBI55_139670 [Parastagonospora nodorum]
MALIPSLKTSIHVPNQPSNSKPWYGLEASLISAKTASPLSTAKQIVPEILGIPIDLGRWEIFSVSWTEVARLPSRHDATDFRFPSTKLASDMDSDVGDSMRLTRDSVDLKPLQLLNRMSYKGAPLVNRDGFYIKIPDKEDGQSSKGELVYHPERPWDEMKIDVDNMVSTASHFEMLSEAERLRQNPWCEEQGDESDEDWASCDERQPQHEQPGEGSDDAWTSCNER